MRPSELSAEAPLLNTPHLVALVMRAAEGGGASAGICAERLAALFRETGEEAPVARDELVARCDKVICWLRATGLLGPGDGAWTLTARGREALERHPQGMDLADLAVYPEFAEYLHAEDAAARRTGAVAARETAYDRGYVGRHSGAAFTENPHDFATADHQQWERGWCEALDEE